MSATGYMGSASTLTRALEAANGPVSLVGSLPNCSAVLSAADGFPSVVSHDRDDRDEAVFLESCYYHYSDGYAPVNVTSSTLFGGSDGFLASNTEPFYPVYKALSCSSSAFLDDDTVEGLDCPLFDLG